MATRDLMLACRKAVEGELRACIGESPSSFYDMIRYHLGWVDQRGQAVLLPGGKMLRPVFCLLACQAAGRDYEHALPAAAAIEMMHNFSLIHDDIQDQSPKRRHRPTLWRVWGQAQAITAGDGLHVMAHLAHLRLLAHGVPADRTLAAMEVLDRACLSLCEGQFLDLTFEDRASIGLAEYLGMVGKKTAALFDASARIGAMLGTEDEEIVEGLGRFGEEIGMAFQIQDDILGIWGMEETTGKPSLDDIRARKKSLPIVHAMATAQGGDGVTLEAAYSVGAGSKPAPPLGDQKVAAVLDVLQAAGSREYCRSLARSYWDRARSHLKALPLEQEAAGALEELAGQLLERQD
ncbi:MAG TPA: polyprenyl synthetase family protein [Dehalococcoidia bacterium]|nr:polyprenyl synthetase family protein [Dehalococcoidia bacterium]